MVGEIAGRLLAVDVAEYIRFRAVCGPWRERTADPRVRRLDARFRPRNWAPGDSHWTLVNPGEASYREYDSQGQLLFHSVLSWCGRCYVASPEGSVYVLELRPPLPRLVEIIDQRRMCPPDTHHLNRVLSFLVGSGTAMLMVRYWIDIKHFGGAEAYDPAELFTSVGGFTGRLEVLELDDIAKPKSERSLLPVRSLGRHAAFVGNTHCLLMSTETFPSLATDAIYLGYRLQRYRTSKFSVYTIDDRRIEPPHQFCLDEEWRGSIPLPGLATLTSTSSAMLTACIPGAD
uniref:KIB1-4 beta-propeller domain-containing protein n=1 Tax=Oryza barthii TaxID=65489 RepID=A0A0D3GYG0_9ORYZ